ncbi:MAG: hypothetical protein ACFFDN_44110 [Candidatus Hodarchaeota archaeon]
MFSKKHPYHFILFFIFLINFNSIFCDKDDIIKVDTNFLTYENIDLCIEFKYPDYWGNIIYNDYSKDEHKCYLLTAAGADYKLYFDNVFNYCDCSVEIYFIKFNQESPFRIICYEGDIDSTNLITEKESIAQNYDKLIDNCKTKITESFFEPDQAMIRRYTLFSEKDMIEIKISVDTFHLKKEKGFTEKGIDYLIKINKSNRELNRFFSDLPKFINSIEFNN